MTKKVLVIGSGPAGLAAVHICAIFGVRPTIISQGRKSQLFGCQYLHEPVPGIGGMVEIDILDKHWVPTGATYIADVGSQVVEYNLEGTPEGYSAKVYGDSWNGSVSPDTLEMSHIAWDIRNTYDILWARYAQLIKPITITNYDHLASQVNLDDYALIISTAPRTLWRQDGDTFASAKAWAVGDAPGIQEVPFKPEQDGVIICDGTNDVSWTRMSRVFDHATIEWPGHIKRPPVSGISELIKPLELHLSPAGRQHPVNMEVDNSVGSGRWLHVGRYGEWKKGVLVSDVYPRVQQALKTQGIIK